MSFKSFFQAYTYSGFDWRGRLKLLLNRKPNPDALVAEDISVEARDEALHLLCEAFGIPESQQYCLRPCDELRTLYDAIVGPRSWDSMEYESLVVALDSLPGPTITVDSFRALTTVGDVIRFVDERRREGGVQQNAGENSQE